MTLRNRLQATAGQRIWRAAADARDAARHGAFGASRAGREVRRDLERYRNAHAGARCVIIGNGPSLRKMDLAPLRDVPTFALNRGYLLAETLGFHSTYLVAVNDHVIEQCADEIAAVPSRKLLTVRAKPLRAWRDDVSFFYSRKRQRFFGDVARAGLWEGATVTFVTMQLAYYMGFKDVALIGVDHSFSTQGPAHKLVTSEAPDPNHFDPRYFGPGFRWQLPDLEMSEHAYGLARQAYARVGRRIVDATVDGKLTVFPKMDLGEWLRGGGTGDG